MLWWQHAEATLHLFAATSERIEKGAGHSL